MRSQHRERNIFLEGLRALAAWAIVGAHADLYSAYLLLLLSTLPGVCGSGLVS